MTARAQTGLVDFLGRVAPALKSVSCSVTQRRKCLLTFRSSTAHRDGEGVQNPKRKPPHTSLPLVACPGFTTCT